MDQGEVCTHRCMPWQELKVRKSLGPAYDVVSSTKSFDVHQERPLTIRRVDSPRTAIVAQLLYAAPSH
jgi:hypothetical protein